MNEMVREFIETHIKLLDACERSTSVLLEHALDNDADKVNAESINRDRLISVITDYYHRIDELITDDEINQETVNLSKEWAAKFTKWLEDVTKMDKQILAALDGMKENTKKDIATVFKARQKFKGYNLQNVRK